VRGGEDVPAHAGEVHPASEERHEHGEKKIAEAPLRPDHLPVHRICRRRCHGTYQFTIAGAIEGRNASSKCYASETNPPMGRCSAVGNEMSCKVRFGKQESDGKALLETSEILFRGDFRLKIPFPRSNQRRLCMANSACRRPKGSRSSSSVMLLKSGARKFFIPSRASKTLG